MIMSSKDAIANGVTHLKPGTPLGPYLSHCPKLRVEKPIYWDHHRGGWQQVVQVVQKNLHCPDGVRFISAVDQFTISREVIEEPWVGFVHSAPHTPYRFPDLNRLLHIDTFRANIRTCQGLWVLSGYVRDFLASKVSCPVNCVHYPAEVPDLTFSFPSFENSRPYKLLFIGEYLRIYDSFYQLDVPGYRKILLRCFLDDPGQQSLPNTNGVEVVDRISNADYDRLLSESVVFLHLFDAPANTVVVECIVRTTPIVVNRIGSIEEYLGPDYPLYYESLEEAAEKLENPEQIAKAVLYLRKWQRKMDLSFPRFLASIQNTAIYRSLPVPRSQQHTFQSADVSVLICSYRRTHLLTDLLTSFTKQIFEGSVEVFVWNNNLAEQERVDEICREFKSALRLKVIHSSENFYCLVRLAIPALMRSDLLMICDDDVLPQPGYLARFLEKYQIYGPNAAICARGHLFLKPALDEEHPEQAWVNNCGVVFLDEKDPDRQIHFMHADNCLIPRRILKQLGSFDMERYEFALVDDYWMSFKLSSELNVELWKIKADDVLSFAPSADDPEVALYRNARVQEERINFYIHHMRRGWPPLTTDIWRYG